MALFVSIIAVVISAVQTQIAKDGEPSGSVPAGQLLVSESPDHLRLDFDVANDTNGPVIAKTLDLLIESNEESWCSCPAGCASGTTIKVQRLALAASDKQGNYVVNASYADGHMSADGTTLTEEGTFVEQRCHGPHQQIHLKFSLSAAISEGSSQRFAVSLPREIRDIDNRVAATISGQEHTFRVSLYKSDGGYLMRVPE